MNDHEECGVKKFWLWKNFENGRPEYWAFDNPYPLRLDCDDPQTIGEPCGYVFFMDSRAGRSDISEKDVLRAINAANREHPEISECKRCQELRSIIERNAKVFRDSAEILHSQIAAANEEIARLKQISR